MKDHPWLVVILIASLLANIYLIYNLDREHQLNQSILRKVPITITKD